MPGDWCKKKDKEKRYKIIKLLEKQHKIIKSLEKTTQNNQIIGIRTGCTEVRQAGDGKICVTPVQPTSTSWLVKEFSWHLVALISALPRTVSTAWLACRSNSREITFLNFNYVITWQNNGRAFKLSISYSFTAFERARVNVCVVLVWKLFYY